MPKDKEKKKFKDTAFGQFLGKATRVIPDLAGVALDVAANPAQGVKTVANFLAGRPDPESQEILMELEAQKAEFEIELAKIDAADRASAREREVALRNTIGVWIQNISAAFIIAGFIAMAFLVTFKPIALSDVQASMANIMTGNLGGLTFVIINYWFGSSEGSRKKDER